MRLSPVHVPRPTYGIRIKKGLSSGALPHSRTGPIKHIAIKHLTIAVVLAGLISAGPGWYVGQPPVSPGPGLTGQVQSEASPALPQDPDDDEDDDKVKPRRSKGSRSGTPFEPPHDGYTGPYVDERSIHL